MQDRWITDWTPSPKFPVYTRANAGEVLPDPASPLGWTMVWEPGVVMGWYDAQIGVGTCEPEELSAERPEVVGSFGGYLYINASLARLFGVRAPGLSPEMIDFIYFGEHPDVPPYVPEPWHESPANTAKLEAWIGRVMTAEDLPELRDDRAEADRARTGRPDLSTLTDTELVARARGFVPLIRHLFCRHLEVTAGASIGPGVLQAVAAALGDPTMPLKLIAGVGDVDSAAPSWAMWDLSRLVAHSAELTADFAGGPVQTLLDRLRASGGRDANEFLRRFAQFLDRFGSRGPNEWDIRSDTWETRPELALSLIDRMRLAPDEESPQHRHDRLVAEREALTEHLLAALAGDPATQAQFAAGLRSAQLYMAGRERTKTNIIKVIHEVRMAIRELAGRHGLTMGSLTMLLDGELDAFVADPAAFTATIAEREHGYLELFDLEPPFILNGSVPPLTSWPRRSGGALDAVAPGTVLTGVPGCPGTATGRARVVLDPADPLALEPGDVLVAPITDPAWTPLFVPAAAVVVDVGAQVSHAVIVSRELGIPCVVSVKDATRRILDGAMVTVDGTTGTVTVH